MGVRSILMIALALAAPACSQQAEPEQAHAAFEKAIKNRSTSPYFVKVKLIDASANQRLTSCVAANLLRGALHLEHGLPYNEAGTTAMETLATSNDGQEFSFRSPSALQNMPWHPSGSELAEAASMAASMSDETLRQSLEKGALRDFYTGHPRHRERMGAVACALIDRGFVPRVADMTGSLYVEDSGA